MNKVFNWQINREMEYPHAEHHPDRQFAFVFNLNRCIGCQTCTMACKSTWTFSKGQEFMWWNNVETKPYGGYPQSWDVKILKLLEEANPGGQKWKDGTFKGKTIFEAGPKNIGDEPQRVLGYLPTDEEWRFPNIYEDNAVGPKGKESSYVPEGAKLPEHKTWFFYLARICNHCTYPGCLAACPRNAIYKRPEDGVVLVDQERCRGYRKCVEACPYKKAMYRPSTRITEKCIACYPRLEGKDPETKGQPMETRCMAACIGQIRLQGLVKIDKKTGEWAEDRYNPIYYLVKIAKVGLPLYPQFGTEPNGFYIPPRWVPRDFLKQMFGPGVDHAIDSYMVPDRELLAVQQLFRKTNQIIFRYELKEGPKVFETQIHGKPFTMYNDTIIGYNQAGKEVVRTQVEEPFHVRPNIHQNSI
ncbi:MAG: 4Fe-4S dicluster domain-containing protein [Desulfobacterales bacterium]|nr:4Fe-4S dicluster domain-containing protein [Desulfobacterales bacterium]